MSFKIHFCCGNPPLCGGVIVVPKKWANSCTFTVILAVFAPKLRWHHKLWMERSIDMFVSTK